MIGHGTWKISDMSVTKAWSKIKAADGNTAQANNYHEESLI